MRWLFRNEMEGMQKETAVAYSDLAVAQSVHRWGYGLDNREVVV